MKKFLSLLLILALMLTMFGGVAMAADECPEGGSHDWRQNYTINCETGETQYLCIKCFQTKTVYAASKPHDIVTYYYRADTPVVNGADPKPRDYTGRRLSTGQNAAVSSDLKTRGNAISHLRGGISYASNLNTCVDAYRIQKYCLNCLYFTDNGPYAPLGHSYGDSWKPTPDQPGYEVGTCVRCGNVWTRPIEGYEEPVEILMSVTKTVEGLEEGHPLVLGRTYNILINIDNLSDAVVHGLSVTDPMSGDGIFKTFDSFPANGSTRCSFPYEVTEEDFERGYIDTPAVITYNVNADNTAEIRSDFYAEVVKNNISTRMPHNENDKDLLKVELVTYPVDGANYPKSEVCELSAAVTALDGDTLPCNINVSFIASNDAGDSYEVGNVYYSGTLNHGESRVLGPVKYRLTRNDLWDSSCVTFSAIATYQPVGDNVSMTATSREVKIFNTNPLGSHIIMTVEQVSPQMDVYYRTDSIHYLVNLKNNGTYTAENVRIDLTKQFDSNPENEFVDSTFVGEIAPGQTVAVDVYERIDGAYFPPDTLHLSFSCVWGRKNTDGPVYSYNLGIGESQDVLDYNSDVTLRVKQVSIKKDVYDFGDWVTFSATLTNRKDEEIANGNIVVRDDATNKILSVMYVGTIPAQQSVTREFTIQVNSPTFDANIRRTDVYRFNVNATYGWKDRTLEAEHGVCVCMNVDLYSRHDFNGEYLYLTVEQTSPVKEVYQKGDKLDFTVTMHARYATVSNTHVWMNDGFGKVRDRDVNNSQGGGKVMESGDTDSYTFSTTISNPDNESGYYVVTFNGEYDYVDGDLNEEYRPFEEVTFRFPVIPGNAAFTNPWQMDMEIEQVSRSGKTEYAPNDSISYLVTLKNTGTENVEDVTTNVYQAGSDKVQTAIHSVGAMASGDEKSFIINVPISYYEKFDANDYLLFVTNFHAPLKGDELYDAIVLDLAKKTDMFEVSQLVEIDIDPDAASDEVNEDYKLVVKVYYNDRKEKYAPNENLNCLVSVLNAGRKELTDCNIVINQHGSYLATLTLEDIGTLKGGQSVTRSFDVPVSDKDGKPGKSTIRTYAYATDVDHSGTYYYSNMDQAIAVRIDTSLDPADDFSTGKSALYAAPEFTIDITQTGTVKERYDEGDVLSFLCSVNARNYSDFDETKVVVMKSGSRSAQKKETTPGTFVYNYTVTEEDAKDGYFTIEWDFYGYQSGKKVYDKCLRALGFYCSKTEEETDNNGSRPNSGSFRRPKPEFETQTENDLPDESNAVYTEDVFLTGNYGDSDDMWATDAYSWNFSIVNEGDTAYTGGYLVVINTTTGDASAEDQLPACAANSTVDGLSTTVVPALDEQLRELVLREAYAVLTAEDGNSVRTNSIFFTVSREPLEGLMHLSVSANLKDEYHANDSVSAVVTVTNTSLAPIYDIDLDVTCAGKNDRDSFYQNLDEFLSGCDCLEPGDSFSFTYDFMLTESDVEAGSFYRGFRATGYNERHCQFALSNQADFTGPMKAGERGSAALSVKYSGKDSIIAAEGTVIGLPLLINNNGSCDLNGFVFTDLVRNEIMQSSIGAKYPVYAGIPDGALVYTAVTAEDIENGYLLRNISVTAEDADPESTLSVTTGFTVRVILDTETTYPELAFTARAVNLADSAWQEGDDVLVELTITNNSAACEIFPEKFVLTLDGAEVASGYCNILFPLSSCVSYCADVLTAQDIESGHYEREILLTYEVYDKWYDSYTATVRGTVSADAPEAAERRVTLSGSTWVKVGSALDGAFGYEWSPNITNETGEKITFDFLFIHNGEEKVDTVPWELEAGESMDYCYGFTPVLTDEEKETILTDADSATTYYTLQVIAHGESGETYYSNVITFAYTVYPSPYAYSISTSLIKLNADGSFVLELGNETPQFTGIDMKIDFLNMDSPSVEDTFEEVELFGDRVFEPGEYDEVTITPHFTDEEYEHGYFEREIEVRGSGYYEKTGKYDIRTSGYITVRGTLNGSAASEEIPETLTVSNARLSDDGRLYFTATNSSDGSISDMGARCGDDYSAPWGTARFAPGDSADGYMEIKFTEEELSSGIFSRDLYLIGYKHASDDVPAAVSPAVHVEGKINAEALKQNGYFSDIEIFAYGVNLTRDGWYEGKEVLVEVRFTNKSETDYVHIDEFTLTLGGAAVTEGRGNYLAPGDSCVCYCTDVLTAQDLEKQCYAREIVASYETEDGEGTVRGRIFMEAPYIEESRLTLSGSVAVDVGSAMNGVTPFEWNYAITNVTDEELTYFVTTLTHNGDEHESESGFKLKPGATVEMGRAIYPELTEEEKAVILTDADSASTYYAMQVTGYTEDGKEYQSNTINFIYTVHAMPYDYGIHLSVRNVNPDGSFVISGTNNTKLNVKLGSLIVQSPDEEGTSDVIDAFVGRVLIPDEGIDDYIVRPHFTEEEYAAGHFRREIELQAEGLNEETGKYDCFVAGYMTVKGTLSGSATVDADWDKDYPLAGTLSITAVPVGYGQLYVTVTNNSDVRADQLTLVCGRDQGLFIGDTHLHAGDTESEDFILNFTEEELSDNHCTRDLYVYAYDTYYSDTIPAFSSNVVHLDFDINDDFSDSGLLKLTAGGQNMYGETVLTLTNMCEQDIEDLTLVGTTNKEHTVEKNSLEAYVNEFNSLYIGFGKNCDITFTYKPTFTAEELANGAYIRNLYVSGYVSPDFWTASNTVTLTGTCGDRKNDAAIALYVPEYGSEKEDGEDMICTREVTIANAGLYPIEGIRVIADSGSIFTAEAERLEPGETTVCEVTFVVEGSKAGSYTHKLIVTANAVGAPAGTVPMANANLLIYLGA